MNGGTSGRQEAAEHWKREGMAFGIHMGDIIDGQNAQMDASQAALDEARRRRR